jgi:hypothetical protein
MPVEQGRINQRYRLTPSILKSAAAHTMGKLLDRGRNQ